MSEKPLEVEVFNGRWRDINSLLPKQGKRAEKIIRQKGRLWIEIGKLLNRLDDLLEAEPDRKADVQARLPKRVRQAAGLDDSPTNRATLEETRDDYRQLKALLDELEAGVGERS